MGTASVNPPVGPGSGSRRGTELFLRKNSLHSIKGRLLEARAPAGKHLPPKTMRELNERLWDAFMSRNTDEMVRIIRAGADPRSIECRIDREIVRCEY